MRNCARPSPSCSPSPSPCPSRGASACWAWGRPPRGAQELAEALSGVEWGKVSRLVVRDAESGEVVREVTDQAEIERAFEPLSEENGLAAEPDEPAEYVFELWQPETQRLGQDAADLDEVKACEVTTYEGSPVVTVEVSPIGLRLHVSSQAAADALRLLAG